MSKEIKDRSGRLLALDLGDKRIGVAVTDELWISISPQPPILVTNWKAVLQAIRRAIESFDAEALVIGWPVNMDGSEGATTEKVRATAAKLEKSITVPIFFQDERLSTESARDILGKLGVSPGERKSLIDSQSAAIILADFISRQAEGGSR